MLERKGSVTALRVSLVRTIHQVVDDLPHILDDPISPKLIDPEVIARILREPEKHNSRAARGLRSHIVLRSRYAEDELREAIFRGLKQFVNLGAGYDTFAYRQPRWANGLRILEIDHPATQKDKRTQFRASGLKDPDNLSFVPFDLEINDLRQGIASSSMDLASPIWFSCLGVFAYLRKDTVLRVLRTVAGLPKGSGIVFAFSPDRKRTIAIPQGPGSVAERAAELGEPWLTRFEMKGLQRELEGCGFTEISFLELREAESRYYSNRTDLPAPRMVRLCKAMA